MLRRELPFPSSERLEARRAHGGAGRPNPSWTCDCERARRRGREEAFVSLSCSTRWRRAGRRGWDACLKIRVTGSNGADFAPDLGCTDGPGQAGKLEGPLGGLRYGN
jgi:hypothetical protein